MKNKIVRNVVIITLLVFSAVLVIGGIWVLNLNQEIRSRLAGRRFAPPVEFYAAPEKIFKGQKFPINDLLALLQRLRLHNLSPLHASVASYSLLSQSDCVPLLPAEFQNQADQCVVFRLHSGLGASSNAPAQLVAYQKNLVAEVFRQNGNAGEFQAVTATALEPELFAQFVNDKPILRNLIQLGDAPPYCLNAVMAIEDSDFLQHGGISITGLGRAIFKNVFRGRFAQGGSTITQQLVKNYFLTSERTLKRKIKEIVMSILLEGQATKDEILETYINEIYMGQNGVFEVRGYGAAAEHYFAKDLSDLSLPECALLAAIVNSPGTYNPTIHPDHAMKRRNLVLEKMTELKLITAAESTPAKMAALPKRPVRGLSEPAPYFVDAVRSQIQKLGIKSEDGLRISTTLNVRAQEAATIAVTRGLEKLETSWPAVKKRKAAGKVLEGVLISSDPLTGEIQALVGGRSFKRSQYNRAIQSRRQVGSVMKPIVYMTALEGVDPEGRPYTPLSILNDEKTRFKYEGQVWEPENYEHKHYGKIPMYFALKNSLNSAAASLGVQTGLDAVVDTAKRLGVTSPMKALPALSLGAFEMAPFEVLQVYTNLSRMGKFINISLIEHIENLEGRTLFDRDKTTNAIAAPENVAVLIGMMKQTVLSGTARTLAKLGFTHPAAGKTGTTNDKKDAWFAGFTPYQAAIVWVGYDDNTTHDLTGTSGAVPIWADYMNQYGSQFPPQDFQWPEGVSEVEFTPITQIQLGIPEADATSQGTIRLIFKKGTEPSNGTLIELTRTEPAPGSNADAPVPTPPAAPITGTADPASTFQPPPPQNAQQNAPLQPPPSPELPPELSPQSAPEPLLQPGANGTPETPGTPDGNANAPANKSTN